MRRVISLLNEEELFKAKCVLAKNLIQKDIARDSFSLNDKVLYMIARDNVGGMVHDANKVNAEVMYELGINRMSFDQCLKILKKEGLLVRRGASYFVHPILVNSADEDPDEVLVRIKPGAICDKAKDIS